MRDRARLAILCAIVATLVSAPRAGAFLEDLCLPRNAGDGTLSWCVRPTCATPTSPDRACAAQTLDFLTIEPGRSMIHADSTYFLAQALGYRADVAYWIAAYNEVTDYTQYVPIDQCGVQAANEDAIANGTSGETAVNSGRDFITARFNGFQRTNLNTDGPLDHYVVPFAPNGQGTDVHGAGGVQAVYPFHYPRPGYPVHLDDVYQKTIYNLRQWGMIPTSEPGLLCTVGLTEPTAEGARCLSGGTISGEVPLITQSAQGIPIAVPTGLKVLNFDASTHPATIVYYDQLGSWLQDETRTTGKLWLDANPGPVPVQLARFGLYLHVLQDNSSHATYCGDDAPSPPGGGDPGTYMFLTSDGDVQLSFGSSCASSPHLAGHVQETGTGDAPLPLRDYAALNNTVDELIAFGNAVALRHDGWIGNRELLPPDVTGGKNGQGQSAADLKATLVGTIVSGTPYSRAEVYQSGVVTLPLQETNSLQRLHAMNRALGTYSGQARRQSRDPAHFVPFAPMPGNSSDPDDTSVCWRPVE